MYDAKRWRVVALVLAGLVVGPPGSAEDPEPALDEAARAAAVAAARAADTEEALGLLKRALDFLAQQQRFSFVAHTGYDALQATGQKLEFGGSRNFLVRRPDRLRVELERREGETATLFFDGRRISISLPEETAYVSVEKPGTLDEAIDYLERDLAEPAPLLDLVHTGLYPQVAERVRYGFRVGDAKIADRRCDHLAFQGEDLDFQIWIEEGDRPLPVRLVITHREEEGSPQFWAQLVRWDLRPDAPDERFAFTPPEGAERLPFAPPASGVRREAGGR